MSGLTAVSLLEQRRNGAGPRWYVMASAGERPPDSPAADVEVHITETLVLAGRGRKLSTEEREVLSRCAVPMVAGLLRRRQDERHPKIVAASRAGTVEVRITVQGALAPPDSEPEDLGLRLARDLTEAMGDTLTFAEGPDSSRAVVITLPAAVRKPLSPSDGTTSSRAGSPVS